jgi:hypothetical protein
MMIKVTLLLPLADNNGKEFPKRDIDSILYLLRQIAGGFTSDGLTNGEYTMDNGDIACDVCKRVFVIVERDKLDSLRSLAALAAKQLRQESIYIEYHETNVEFVRA